MRNFLNYLFDIFCGGFIATVFLVGISLIIIGFRQSEATKNHELYESYIRATGNPKNIQEVDFIRLKDAKLIKIE